MEVTTPQVIDEIHNTVLNEQQIKVREIVQREKIMELKLELLPHHPYSPYLAPSDFFISELEEMTWWAMFHVK